MLLDRYPDVGRIVLVVRSKGGVGPAERFWRDIATSEALEPLRRALGSGFEAFLRDEGARRRRRHGAAPVRPRRVALARASRRRSTPSSTSPASSTSIRRSTTRSTPTRSARRTSWLWRVPSATCRSCTRAPATSPACAKGRSMKTILARSPFPRAGELDASLWDPDREIAECLDLIAQARHRCEDAFRQSEFAETRASEPPQARRARARRTVRRRAGAGEAQVRQRPPRRSGPRARHPLGLAEHLHVHQGHRRAGHRAVRPADSRSRVPPAARPRSRYPFPAFNEGINTSAPLIYLMMKGQLQHSGRARSPRSHSGRLRRGGDDPRAGRAARRNGEARLPVRRRDVNPCTAQRFGELVGLYKRQHFQRKATGNPLWNVVASRFEPTFVDRTRFDAVGPPALSRVSRDIAALLRKTVPVLAPAAEALEGLAKREAKIARDPDAVRAVQLEGSRPLRLLEHARGLRASGRRRQDRSCRGRPSRSTGPTG